MRKILLSILGCTLSIFLLMAQDDETGFASSSDLIVGYKNKSVSTTLGIDFGYKIFPNLYIGVGPMGSASFGKGNSTFAGGGYGKIRFILPFESEIRPFIDGRVAYSYSFSGKTGNMFYGAGIGLRFSKSFSAGLYCLMDNSTVTSTEKVANGQRYWYDQNHKKHSYIDYKNVTVENDKMNFTPSILVSFFF